MDMQRIFEDEGRDARPKAPVRLGLPWACTPRRCEPRPMPGNPWGIARRPAPSGRAQLGGNSVDSIWPHPALGRPKIVRPQVQIGRNQRKSGHVHPKRFRAWFRGDFKTDPLPRP